MDSVQKAGSFLGSAGIMVMDDSVCMVWALMVLERFFHHESCGQCTPCRRARDGSTACSSASREGAAVPRDVDLLLSIAGNMLGTTICALSEAAAMPAPLRPPIPRRVRAARALGRCPLRSEEPRRAHG